VIVVDIGCAKQESEESVYTLCERFKPALLFGFDPELEAESIERYEHRTTIIRSRQAAWVSAGSIPWISNGIASGVPRGDHPGEFEVPCFDLIAFLRGLIGHALILKMDCEGAEYPIMRALRSSELDRRLELVLVEWHSGPTPEGWYDGKGWEDMGRTRLRCPVELWQ
jgi:FkbM family methyltransferase